MFYLVECFNIMDFIGNLILCEEKKIYLVDLGGVVIEKDFVKWIYGVFRFYYINDDNISVNDKSNYLEEWIFLR